MKDEWIDKLPQKMADWTPEVPEGVWESVEAAVPAVAGGRRWRPVIYLASAVSIAAAIVAAVMFRHQHSSTQAPSVEAPLIAQASGSVPDMETSPSAAFDDEPAAAVPASPVRARRPVRVAEAAPATDAAPAVLDAPGDPAAAEAAAGMDAPAADEDAVPIAAGPREISVDEVLGDTRTADVYGDFSEADVPVYKRAAEISFGASYPGGAAVAPSNPSYETPVPVLASQAEGTPLRKSPAQHGDPVAAEPLAHDWQVAGRMMLGATLPLKGRLDVTTGLAWTMLRCNDEQLLSPHVLHYAGVPVRLGVTVLDSHAISLGINAGGECAWCVSSPATAEVSGIQLSASAGVDASCRISRSIRFRLGVDVDAYLPSDGGAFGKTTFVPSVNAGLFWLVPLF